MPTSRLALAVACGAWLAAAAPAEDRVSSFLSGPGTRLYLGASVLLPLARDGSDGGLHSLRTLDALATNALLTEGLKRMTRVRRPDAETHNSFPSGHTSSTFCMATMMSAYRPKEAPLWFLGAGLIGYSRVKLRRHRILDVVAGAALGYLVARAELSSPRGLVLSPIIPRRGISTRDVPDIGLSIRF